MNLKGSSLKKNFGGINDEEAGYSLLALALMLSLCTSFCGTAGRDVLVPPECGMECFREELIANLRRRTPISH